jgi:acyl-coenzyme A synthetase/AMP-(fatty) acid ligase
MTTLALTGSSNQIVDARTGRATRWGDWREPTLDAPTAAVVASGVDAARFVQAHVSTGAELLVVAQQRLDQELSTELRDAGFELAGEERAAPNLPRIAEAGRLWLLTSGTTSRPKRIGHTLASLTTLSSPQQPRRWLCPYSAGTYAWWQLVTLGLTQPGQDIVMVDPGDLDSWPDAALEHGVTAVTGTPTFWRHSLLQHGEQLARLELGQVTLGGEPVDQTLLDELCSRFPAARVSWIYASSEMGASIVVHDGKAGFPVEWLDRRVPGRPELSLRGEELVISSPHHGVGLGGMRTTGDRAVVENGRVHIRGRIDGDEINVGGTKLSAGAIRDVLTSHPVVAWARVSGRRAPVVGTVVTAEVVLSGWSNLSADGASAMLAKWCRDRLPEQAVPRMFRFRDHIPSRESLKTDV